MLIMSPIKQFHWNLATRPHCIFANKKLPAMMTCCRYTDRRYCYRLSDWRNFKF